MGTGKISIAAAFLILAFGCTDLDRTPLVTFDTVGKGAFPRLVGETARDINLFDIEGSKYIYTIEFVDAEQGNLVSQYTLEMRYEDAEGENTTGFLEFRNWSSSEFETLGNGFIGLTNITITALELVAAVGIKADDLSATDFFEFRSKIVTTDGRVFSAYNSSATVQGPAFRSHFDFRLSVSCPTDLAGTYKVNVKDSWCGSVADFPETQVTWTWTPSGYRVDDFSFGAYDNCYGPGSLRPLGDLRIVDVCNIIFIRGTSQWGEIYTWSNLAVNGEVLSFNWFNDYGEWGAAEVINPQGWPPLRLAK